MIKVEIIEKAMGSLRELINFKIQSNVKVTDVDVKMIRKVIQDSNRELYKELEIGSDCPECDGNICWYGSTKHHPNHFRCNRGCVL